MYFWGFGAKLYKLRTIGIILALGALMAIPTEGRVPLDKKIPIEDETQSQLAGAANSLAGPRLLALWEGGAQALPLPFSGKIVMGRSLSSDLQIGSSTVSREHALLHWGPEPSLEDLGSSNGTRVDGVTLEPGQRAALRPGCVIELGSVLVLVQGAPFLHRPDGPALGAAPAEVEPFSHSAMEQVQRLARLVARGPISVILRGETGVGKEVLAKYLHEHSEREKRPFLRINCAAFAESMVESELFGHEKGAFTGAQREKVGLLEAASGGTVLLDEVGELSLAVQAKLLRAIGNREVLRVGATRPRPIDVRFLAATHRDLESMVERDEFRSDLYFRLNGITLWVPPLRERREEILPLAEQFAREAASKLGISAPVLAPEVRNQLLEWPWPGNVRELLTVMERAVLLAQGKPISLTHLGLSVPARNSSHSKNEAPKETLTTLAPPTSGSGGSASVLTGLRDEMQELEYRRIVEAIQRCGGNQTKAAKLLGISRRALLHRLDTYGLPRPRKSPPTT